MSLKQLSSLETKIIFACTTNFKTLLKTLLCDIHFDSQKEILLMKLKLVQVNYTTYIFIHSE